MVSDHVLTNRRGSRRKKKKPNSNIECELTGMLRAAEKGSNGRNNNGTDRNGHKYRYTLKEVEDMGLVHLNELTDGCYYGKIEDNGLREYSNIFRQVRENFFVPLRMMEYRRKAQKVYTPR